MDPYVAPRIDDIAERESPPGRLGVLVRVMMILDLIFSGLALFGYAFAVVIWALGIDLASLFGVPEQSAPAEKFDIFPIGLGIVTSLSAILAAILILNRRRFGIRCGWLALLLMVSGLVVHCATQNPFATMPTDLGPMGPMERLVAVGMMIGVLVPVVVYNIFYAVALVHASRQLRRSASDPERLTDTDQ